MHKSADGFATGGRDGVIKLWDVDFNPLTTLDMNIKPLESEGFYDQLNYKHFFERTTNLITLLQQVLQKHIL